MSFSNQTMVAPVEDKPHIAKIDGWWRVSPKPRCTRNQNTNAKITERWFKAHSYILGKNFSMTQLKFPTFGDVAKNMGRGTVLW